MGSHAPEPHRHLAWLGVDPRFQEQRTGSAFMRRLTIGPDAEDHTCSLFSFASRNVAI